MLLESRLLKAFEDIQNRDTAILRGMLEDVMRGSQQVSAGSD